MSKSNPLLDAILYRDSRLAKKLVRQGVPLSTKSKYGVSAVHEAAGSHMNGLLRLLIETGGDVHGKADGGITPLMWAAVHKARNAADARATITILLDAGARIDDLDDNGMTALMKAALFNNFQSVSTLIAAGANVNATTFLGATALIYAIHSRRPRLVKQLLEAGADPLLAAVERHSPLDYAKAIENRVMIRMLKNAVQKADR